MQSTAELAQRLYGTTEPRAPFRNLRAGKLTARLEGGNLRYVRFAGRECLRAVAYIIRDRDWGTYQPPIKDLVVEETDREFRVSYRGSCESDRSNLHFRAEIVGEASGHLTFRVEATPDGPFETNRCGFNVLHPLEAAGCPVRVEHVDGAVEETTFPELIEPRQPFKAIRALTFRPEDAFDAICLLEGDTFEMEDQRNWSDASFKTYVRPIELPWPYDLPGGETNRQSVTLDIAGYSAAGGDPASGEADAVVVRVGLSEDVPATMPAIGLVVTPDEAADAVEAIDHLGALGPQTILCPFDPTAGHGGAAFEAFAALQRDYPADYSLECVVTGTGGSLSGEFRHVAEAVASAGFDISSIAVCPSVDRQSTPPGSEWPDCPPLADIYRAARAAFPDIPLGGGMFSYFTELNRKRPPVDLIDFVAHATNPIVHAADDESVMETLSTLPHITHSTRAIIGVDKPYRIGPSTIGMRQNPYGSRTMPNAERRRICMAAADPRQDGLFAAAWTVGYAAAVAPAGLDLLTLSAFTGPRGALASAGGSVRPVFHALKWLAAMAGSKVVGVETADTGTAAIAARGSNGLTLLIANLSAVPKTVDIRGVSNMVSLDVLDAAGLQSPGKQSASESLRLEAYGIVRMSF